MEGNQFGRTSSLMLTATANAQGKTVLQDVSFTAPFKVMEPFSCDNGLMQVMILAASAGIMEGDRQEFSFSIQSGAALEVTSQAYEKIHQMAGKDCAKRYASITIADGGFFRYNPQATVPFADSSFDSTVEVHLQGKAGFQWSEIFTCGRYMRGERFAYKRYTNLVTIYRDERLIYRDNVQFRCNLFDMSSMGMFEQYTHMASIFVSKPCHKEDFVKKTSELLQEAEQQGVQGNAPAVEGGITELSDGDYAIRIFGTRAQTLEHLKERIMDLDVR